MSNRYAFDVEFKWVHGNQAISARPHGEYDAPEGASRGRAMRELSDGLRRYNRVPASHSIKWFRFDKI